MKIIKTTAPTRIDLAGGTIDLPPLYLFHYPAPTINIAIDIRTSTIIRPSKKFEVVSRDQRLNAVWDKLPDAPWKKYPRLELILRLLKSFKPEKPVRLETNSQAPAGSGLGGSSSLAITLTHALSKWRGYSFSKEELIEYAKSVETQTIKVPTGYQDYWAAVYGGINAYEMGLDGTLKRTPLGSPAFHQELERHRVLVYAGQPRFSGTNNWELFKRHIDSDIKTVNFFEKIKENALLMKKALESEKINNVANALNQDWKTRKSMLPKMTTPIIEKLMKEMFRGGALAARVCGAGGGGCVLFLAEPDKRTKLIKQIKKMNMSVLPAKISKNGVTIKKT